ncbi:hypothetical protein IWQ62_006065 [Dispira parvispora]|uniref:MSP domain-containing protein n=1 Tax=Dispira parvispora TaxID=1520584 RepID=A0A9W8AJ63_9FUNG|nr:hypothetical protein IWQ62_006065 [Dispira parvispora]
MGDDGPLLRISPSEFHFVPAEGAPGGYVGRLVIKNLRSSAVGFKFKTNAPEKFSVKPVYGALHTLGESVEVTARCLSPVNLEDRFLIQTVSLSSEEGRHLSSSMWRSFGSRRVREGFVNCRMAPQGLASPDTLQPSRRASVSQRSVRKTAITAARSRKRFSWLSVLEIPFMTLQLVVYLLYHLCRHVAQYYERFFTKPRIRRQFLVGVVCVIVVLGALSIKRFLFLPSKRLLSDAHSDPVTSPQST